MNFAVNFNDFSENFEGLRFFEKSKADLEVPITNIII